MDAISFEGVRLRLGARTVLDDVTLRVGGAEFVGVLGANGAGKTTLMRAVLGLVAPAAGRVRVLGEAARRGNPRIGYMPQARGGMAGLRLRGRDFVASVVDGHRAGLPWLGREGAREVDRALDLVGARTLALRSLNETSGGERQRLLLAQALVGRPRLLLLDEPLISLDPHHVADVVALVRGVQLGAGDHGAVLGARAEPVAGGAGPRAVPGRGCGGAGDGGRGHHGTGAVAAVRGGDRGGAGGGAGVRDVGGAGHAGGRASS